MRTIASRVKRRPMARPMSVNAASRGNSGGVTR
jgi:hypothetical protein